MSTRARILGTLGAVVATAAAGAAVAVVRRRRIIARRGAGDHTPFGSLRSEPRTVVASDGCPLHAEVDEASTAGGLTVVFVHGYCLSLDSWHFQRAGYRGLVRTVFYDQRSHGRSGRSDREHATIEQLGDDLRRVLEALTDGPVVLVGHSMGGMSILALAEEHPEMFGDKIVAVGLLGTTAGALEPHRILFPTLPAKPGVGLGLRAVALLGRGHRAVDGVRRLGRAVATVITDRFAFGDDVPASYVEFVDRMIAQTPFEVIAEFFPAFGSLDKFAVLKALESVPVSIICGTEDRLTSVSHSRRLHEEIDGSTLLECDGAGHLIQMERHEQVNAALDQLLAAAGERVRG